MAAIPPTDLFDRFFRERLSPEDQKAYRGRANLSSLPNEPVPVSMYRSMRDMLNAALAVEKFVPEHADHGPFHFDYIDSIEPNALAFCAFGYSFIGMTTLLMNAMLATASRVAESADVAALFDMRLPVEQPGEMSVEQRIVVMVFRVQFSFIALHEWSHVVHGHVRADASDTGFASEIQGRTDGNIDAQAQESDADGYAAYHVLENIINDPSERAHLVSVLAMGDKSVEEQDRLLLCCLIIAVAAFLFTCEPQLLTSETATTFEHPPQALRMNLLMKNVHMWCRQNRQALYNWLTPEPYKALMNMVAAATWGMNGGNDWSQQIEFLRSPEGKKYAEFVERTLIAQVLRGYRS